MKNKEILVSFVWLDALAAVGAAASSYLYAYDEQSPLVQSRLAELRRALAVCDKHFERAEQEAEQAAQQEDGE